MQDYNELQQHIAQAKNLFVLFANNEPESAATALALFYTVKEMGKNVNVLTDGFPKKLEFLVPSLEFLSQPQNFVIAIPRTTADISQIYYETSEESVKIHLTTAKGQLTKDHLTFYSTQAKPDLTLALGIKNFQKELGRLDAFGSLLDSAIINIDSAGGLEENTRYGKMNIVEPASLSETTFKVIRNLGEQYLNKNTANALLAGLVIHYQNFQSEKTTPEVFQLAADLMKRGANYHHIVKELQKTYN